MTLLLIDTHNLELMLSFVNFVSGEHGERAIRRIAGILDTRPDSSVEGRETDTRREGN